MTTEEDHPRDTPRRPEPLVGHRIELRALSTIVEALEGFGDDLDTRDRVMRYLVDRYVTGEG